MRLKLFRVRIHHYEKASTLIWRDSAPSAENALKVALKTLPDIKAESSIELVEIPTDKQGLLIWLNENFKTDNS
jgi:hypothetical protein